MITDNITIIDGDGNMLFSGRDDKCAEQHLQIKQLR